jgi:hypothetical protein
MHPDAVTPQLSSAAVGRKFAYKFPRSSVVVIELEREKS